MSAADRRTIIVAIGASMGGPAALQKIIPELPPELRACVLVAQHMPEEFTGQLAERLNEVSRIPVRQAADRMRVTEGVVLVAPGGHHMTLSSKWRVCVEKASDGETFIPSIDSLFESVARNSGPNSAGVILTGMGKDGVRGIGLLKAAGAKTIAQDEATSTIFGMPKAAIEGGAVDRVVPLDDIAREVVAAVETIRAVMKRRETQRGIAATKERTI